MQLAKLIPDTENKTEKSLVGFHCKTQEVSWNYSIDVTYRPFFMLKGMKYLSKTNVWKVALSTQVSQLICPLFIKSLNYITIWKITVNLKDIKPSNLKTQIHQVRDVVYFFTEVCIVKERNYLLGPRTLAVCVYELI